MSMKSRRTTVMLRVSVLTALVVAFVIAAVSFFVAEPAHGAENIDNNPHPQIQEVMQDEKAQGTAQLEADAHRRTGSGSDPHCLLVGVEPNSGPKPDQLTPTNTLRIPWPLCLAFLDAIDKLAYEGMIDPMDLIYKPVH